MIDMVNKSNTIHSMFVTATPEKDTHSTICVPVDRSGTPDPSTNPESLTPITTTTTTTIPNSVSSTTTTESELNCSQNTNMIAIPVGNILNVINTNLGPCKICKSKESEMIINATSAFSSNLSIICERCELNINSLRRKIKREECRYKTITRENLAKKRQQDSLRSQKPQRQRKTHQYKKGDRD